MIFRFDYYVGSAGWDLRLTPCLFCFVVLVDVFDLVQCKENSLEFDGTATAILRMQFESVVRLMWLHFCASDNFIESYAGSIDVDNPPKDFPTITDMIEKIKKSGVKGPGESLEEFKDVAWKGMNNHIHNGYLALSRHVNSYPEKLVIQIISNSNSLNLMTAMVLATINQSQADVSFVKNLQLSYHDIMPELRFN